MDSDDNCDEGAPEDVVEEQKHRKGKKHKHGKRKQMHVWYAFVQRAFVGTVDMDDVRDHYG